MRQDGFRNKLYKILPFLKPVLMIIFKNCVLWLKVFDFSTILVHAILFYFFLQMNNVGSNQVLFQLSVKDAAFKPQNV